ncbi:MAG: T9SS type A sorting domain-containing protein [Phaeodactylibacter xiamenensis]|uniref:Secretion system C-terminal sorting domain-containing protein n=1 Tax=Phaeodactylibacter xiamenensis TaxID=1524460 RepID=A0A098RZH9_9BACT|nr:T9SS type A sorting domain-containing protein [Phaeodactylibacter xiamenensis]KGE84958.1 hypothetical protein IX84_30525 [Phaeodactylibacter xiamenensis]
MKYLIILTCGLFLFFEGTFVMAQGIWAADMTKKVSNQTVTVNVRIFRKGDVKDSIMLDWGDGTTEVISPPAVEFLSIGLNLETYFGIHVYEEPGIYEISFRDSFLVDGVVNIEDSGNKSIHLVDSLNVFHGDSLFDYNDAPEPLGIPAGSLQNEGRMVFFYNLHQTDILFHREKWLFELAPFPSEGYTFPEYTDSLANYGATVYWDRPITTGIYAFNLKASEFLNFAWHDSTFLSTTNRLMMVEIDSSLLVNNILQPISIDQLTLFPNPATDLLTISLPKDIKPHQREAHIYDMAGKLVMTKVLNHFETEISIGNLPSGLYQVRVEEFTGRFIKI